MLFFNLSAFYFFYFAAVAVYIIFMPKVLHDIGYTPSEIGVIFALAPLMRFITPFLFLKHIKLDQNMFKTALYLSVISCLMCAGNTLTLSCGGQYAKCMLIPPAPSGHLLIFLKF